MGNLPLIANLFAYPLTPPKQSPRIHKQGRARIVPAALNRRIQMKDLDFTIKVNNEIAQKEFLLNIVNGGGK